MSLDPEHEPPWLDLVEPYWDAALEAEPGRPTGDAGAEVETRRTPVCPACGLPVFGPSCTHCDGTGPWAGPEGGRWRKPSRINART